MQELFDWFSNTIGGSLPIAVTAAFVWGILSLILSPCHLASIPLIVGFIDSQGNISTKRAFVISTLFSAGILITIGAIGVVTSLLGRLAGDVGAYGNYAVALVFIVVGLYLWDVIKNPFSGPAKVNMERRGALAAFILGLVFGIALGPCTFAYMGPILAICFTTGSEDIMKGILLLVVYGVGHCLMIVLAGTFAEVVQHYLHWTEKSSGAIILKRICGVLVMLGGLYMLYKA